MRSRYSSLVSEEIRNAPTHSFPLAHWWKSTSGVSSSSSTRNESESPKPIRTSWLICSALSRSKGPISQVVECSNACVGVSACRCQSIPLSEQPPREVSYQAAAPLRREHPARRTALAALPGDDPRRLDQRPDARRRQGRHRGLGVAGPLARGLIGSQPDEGCGDSDLSEVVCVECCAVYRRWRV